MIETYIADNHFRLLAVRPLEEMQGNIWEMEHPKSGAKLVWLERPDENMTFSIAFRTIPTDSTGVFHILEHSVLGGSEKYPVKEPFVELLKSSLKTFLNAMTFPDKTLYPVSSRNKQDFHNLMCIYMDAVLHPLAVKQFNVFRQEGWRVEMEDGKPKYQGVVYNEMKGAFSDVRSVLEHTMMEALYPDTCYRHECGGDPAHIPELTYEQFCAEHARYYHPSNGLIVLDGQLDMQDTLSTLDGILCAYDRQEMVFPIAMQQPLPYRRLRVPYEVGAEEELDGKTIVSFGKLLCGFDDPETLLCANILADYLAGGTEGPLKKAILEEGLGADVKVSLHDGMQQAWFGWQVWNTDEEKLPRILEVVRGCMADLVENGLDQERLKGCCASMAFDLLNRDGSGFPRGLLEVINVLESWLYGGDPAQNLAYRERVDSLEEKAANGYFENLLKNTLLDTQTGVLAVLVPDRTLGQIRVEQEQERVTCFWASLTEEEKKTALSELETLHTWQHTPDTEEALAAIPMLKLEDLTEEPKPLGVSRETIGSTPLLRHSLDSDLVYMDLHFEASDADPEEMPLLNLLGQLLGEMATETYNGAQLQTKIKQNIGELNLNTNIYEKDPDHHRIVFTVQSVCLPAHRAQTAQLLKEILRHTQFTDTKLLKDMLKREQSSTKRRLISNGNSFAALRVGARNTSAGVARENFFGCSYIQWINDHADMGEEGLAALLDHLNRLAKSLFTRKRLVLSLSENGMSQAEELVNAFPDYGAEPPMSGSFPLLPRAREGVRIPGGVGYAAKGANLKRLGLDFGGQTYVLSNLLSFQHLWAEIRVKGGAYGSGFVSNENGNVFCYSFRDPSPEKSLGHFDACADFADNFCRENPDLTKFILGALSDTDPLLGAAGKMRLAESRYFKNTSKETVSRLRNELRTATPEDLNRICKVLREAYAEDVFCVIGGEQQLEAVKPDVILDVM